MARHAVLKSFYASSEWTTLRMALINERGITCEVCSRRVAKSRQLIAHHTIELTTDNVHDRMISLNPELIQLICFDCHNQIHKRFGYHNKKEVYIVYGPPLSGKTTYVAQNMLRGDLIINMDALYEAVSMQPTFDKPDSLFANVNVIHNALLDNVRTRYGKWTTAWIVGGYADKYKREKLADDLGAELIFCDVSLSECMSRLKVDERRKDFKDEWKKYIFRWFEKYSE